MDELRKLIRSRQGHKLHLWKILQNVEAILQKLSIHPSDTILLAEYRKQLQLKADIFSELDEKIIHRTNDEERLEAAVFESADLQTMLSEKIAIILYTLDNPVQTRVEPTQPCTDNPQRVENTPLPMDMDAEPSEQTGHSHSQTVHDHPVPDLPPVHHRLVQDPPPVHDCPVQASPPLVHVANSHSSLPTGLTTSHHVTTEHPPHSQESVHRTTGGHSTTRLPKLDIPVFTGEPLEWQSFWDCFEAAIDTNPSLTGVQKLSYLRAQLRGEATRAIAGFPLTNLNYHHLVSILRDRYGQPHKIINSHVQALLDLPKPTNKLASLRLFYNTIESHVRCLHSLGKSPDSLETLLVPMILAKIPEDTKRNIARDHPTSEWTVEELQAAILKEITIFEMGQQTTTTTNHQQSVPTASFYTATNRRPGNIRKDGSGKLTCAYCKGSHAASACEVHKNTSARLEVIKQKRLCYNCLGRHRVSQCNSNNRCRKCNGKHHTSICTDANKLPGDSNHTTNNTQPPTTSNTTLTTLIPSHLTRNATCLLKTAIATVVGVDTQTEANILFDEGSQRSFLTEKLANELAVEPYKSEHISLSSFGADRPLYKMMDTVLIHIRTSTGELVPLSALIVPTIATPICNTFEVNVSQLPHLQGLTLAHPITGAENFEISLLVGADYYWDLVGDHIVRGQGPTAMSSKLGYLLSGPVSTPRHSNVLVNMLHTTAEHEEETNLLKFWQIEDTAITPEGDSSQQFLKSYCVTHISRQNDGTYCARFPWKESHPPLPNNFSVCQKRTRSLVYRLSQSTGLLQIYDNILKDQLERGFIELVAEPNKGGAVHYIPHHPVKKDSVTTPIRIVYDCSCHQSNMLPSLNDCLMAGPHFLVDLSAILLRFRTHQYGLSTDIEKAFLHITLKESDRDFTRFLWLTNPSDPNSEFVTYRFRRVLFGAVSSPFMLFATLHYHLDLYDTPLSHNIQSNLYVDNIVTGCETESQAIEFFQEARSMMSCAGFNLRAWASNCEPLNKKAKDNKVASNSHLTNVLGLLWDTGTDQLSLTSKITNTAATPLTTKRQVLKDASKLFDPFGIASPVSVRAKLFMQKLWQLHVKWDEPLADTTTNEWFAILNDIQQLSQLTINQRFFQTKFCPTTTTLHVFADASTRAYGAVAYLTSGSEITLVMAKNRVAPLKTLTLPKLELMAAIIAARVAKFIIDALHLLNTHTYFWGDSQITLHWLESSKVLPQFITRRVEEIKAAVPGATWSYCPTIHNPADLLTRGVDFKSLSSPTSLWWKGPTWLTTPEAWPRWTPQPSAHLLAAAATAEDFTPQSTATTENVGLHQVIKLTDYSSLNRLLAITAYVYRYVNNLRKSQPKLTGPLTSEELRTAQTRWIRNCQERVYPKELANAKPKPGHPTANTPPLVRQLRLFLDKARLLRCGGRIHNAPLSELAKFPYLLPQNNHLTKLIVYHTHTRLSHAGVGSTLTALRQSFWIPTGRQYVKKLLCRCNICRKHCGRPYAVSDSAPLPKIRVQEVPPFSITGVDFTGALYMKHDNGDEGKAYICLFTCATSRAVHLEVVCDLSTTTFLMAFRRFAARRSLPQVMMSDNATTYTSAAEELTNTLNAEKIRSMLGRERIVWKFIPKKAPWFGGYWERLIGLTKNSIKKTLGRAHISLLTLQTIIVEIEALLNDRPLTYVSDDISDPEPLTPAHILHGRRLTRLPHEQASAEKLHDPDYCGAEQVRKDARTQSVLLEHFTARWKHEYLTSLREFHRPFGKGGQVISAGDVVLVHDDCPRINWKMAIVEGLVKGNDGMVRSATIRTRNGITNRPVAKLYPLELSSDARVEMMDNKEEQDLATQTGQNSREDTAEIEENKDMSVTDNRPQRGATQRARQKLAEWIETIRGPPEDVEDA